VATGLGEGSVPIPIRYSGLNTIGQLDLSRDFGFRQEATEA